METGRNVFQAIADLTRRQILNFPAKQFLNLNALFSFDVLKICYLNSV